MKFLLGTSALVKLFHIKSGTKIIAQFVENSSLLQRSPILSFPRV